ncbi:Uma2 family endonuclease [Methylopila henanensis]|uniref:Uma2 family endonuclease n=1 Tax=Methylopila henanensis TaxID=873516 RepID=A0ABW4KAE8_9HYPH
MNAPVRSLAEGLLRRRFTVADVVRMVEVGLIDPDERLEILDGEIVPMSPKGNRHEGIKVALNMVWGRACPDTHTVAPETGLYLSDRTYLEPDFVVFPRSVRKADLKGPDVLLAVEVADASLDYDLNRKPLIYAAFGVVELWVIDAARREIHRFAEPGPDGYGRRSGSAATERLLPERAPAAFALRLDDLPEV